MDENTQPVALAGAPKAHQRRAFRADLRAKGVTGVDAMALAFREKWAYGWLRSYRLACGLTAAYVDLFFLETYRPALIPPRRT